MQETRDAPITGETSRGFSWAWLGVVPFFLFAFLFMLWPAASLFIGSFQDRQGNFTLDNIIGLTQPFILNAYSLSIQISLVTAIAGGLFGFLLAYAVTLGGLPPQMRTALMTFCGVASNFAGVPLAFAFISTLGRVGFITVLLRDVLGWNLYNMGFTLYGFWGLSLTYLYFQLPLMVLIISPALDGLKREWREASENLGATRWQYWRYVALPILLPPLLGATILLFGNAFGAYATAAALASTSLNLATIVIGAQIRGDVLNNPGLGYALALGMVVVMTISITGYSLLQRRSEKWLR
ncbi:MAG TPA: ABC transporter permease subunit [Anaerolineae bacterium]|nr:ABC transporter permease subunit [Anaerolineae bacterium]HXV99197.1 ABC transporter permease subunit [Anaerolineae bacterium]